MGVLGGGQLGRMLGLAARRMGYRFRVFDPEADSPAGQLADAQTCAKFDDVQAARAFASEVGVITFEFENVPAATLAAVSAMRPTHPSPRVLDICRHRRKEKTFLRDAGLPVAPFAVVRDAGELQQAAAQIGLPAILKTAEFGYDGKGQIKLTDAGACDGAWAALRTSEAVLEGFVPFSKEVSVVAARDVRGNCQTYPLCENEHANHILDVTTVPADVPAAVSDAARALAMRVMQALDVVGVLAVEMFVVPAAYGHGEPAGAWRLIINELAPRPHNSGHFSVDACVTDQFEQQLRAVCGLSLGDPSLRAGGAAMANLLGDLWFDNTGARREPDWSRITDMADVKLHLYGKAEPRVGRKMGHLTVTAATPAAARRRVIEARERLRT